MSYLPSYSSSVSMKQVSQSVFPISILIIIFLSPLSYCEQELKINCVFTGSILKQLQFQCWTNPLIRQVEKL